MNEQIRKGPHEKLTDEELHVAIKKVIKSNRGLSVKFSNFFLKCNTSEEYQKYFCKYQGNIIESKCSEDLDAYWLRIG